jgi:hypothetical protein
MHKQGMEATLGNHTHQQSTMFFPMLDGYHFLGYPLMKIFSFLSSIEFIIFKIFNIMA